MTREMDHNLPKQEPAKPAYRMSEAHRQWPPHACTADYHMDGGSGPGSACCARGLH